MRHEQFWLSVAVFAAFVHPPCAAAETFTLVEALGTAYDSNPQLAAERAALRATDENVAQAASNFRPSASASGSYGYEKIPPIFGGKPVSYPLSGQVQVTQS